MNLGLRKMQISRAAVPPKRIRPIQRCSCRLRGRARGTAADSLRLRTMISIPCRANP